MTKQQISQRKTAKQTMKAAVAHEFGKPLTIEEVQMPDVLPGTAVSPSAFGQGLAMLRRGGTMALVGPVPRILSLIRLLHTLVWVFFAGCILAMLCFAVAADYRTAFVLAAVVSIEVLILLLNGMRCPLTGWAANYTTDRHSNFDIYLPNWLARYNKLIFGTLYFAGIVIALAGWLGWL